VLSAYGDTPQALSTVAAVGAGVSEILLRLRALTPPDVPVVVATVYDPSDGTADTARAGLPPWLDVVDVISELNATLRTAAAAHGAVVAERMGRRRGAGGILGGAPAVPLTVEPPASGARQSHHEASQ
jgi:hypothetical protein